MLVADQSTVGCKVGPSWIEVAQACPIKLGSWEFGGVVKPFEFFILLMLCCARIGLVIWQSSLSCYGTHCLWGLQKPFLMKFSPFIRAWEQYIVYM